MKLAQSKTSVSGGGSISEYAFTHGDYPFAYKGEGYDGGQVKVFGSIKDLDAFNKVYRIYVEVLYYGHRATMSWDKVYSEGLTGSLNREGTAFNKSLEMAETSDGKMTDRLLDRIKEIARTASHSGLPTEAAEALSALRGGQAAFSQPSLLSGKTLVTGNMKKIARGMRKDIVNKKNENQEKFDEFMEDPPKDYVITNGE